MHAWSLDDCAGMVRLDPAHKLSRPSRESKGRAASRSPAGASGWLWAWQQQSRACCVCCNRARAHTAAARHACGGSHAAAPPGAASCPPHGPAATPGPAPVPPRVPPRCSAFPAGSRSARWGPGCRRNASCHVQMVCMHREALASLQALQARGARCPPRHAHARG